MTFVAQAAKQAVAEFESKYGSGGSEDFIRTRILKNFYRFRTDDGALCGGSPEDEFSAGRTRASTRR